MVKLLSVEGHGGFLFRRCGVWPVQPGSNADFWNKIPLDELISAHGVGPISDLGELDSIWSAGNVFDDALSELMADRARRRRGVRAKRSAE